MEAPEDEKQASSTGGKPALVVESLKEEPSAGWPSFGTLVADLLKLAVEGVGNLVLNVVPQRLKKKTGLTPLKDRLVMPEDGDGDTATAKKLSSTPMRSETMHAPTADNEATAKGQKSSIKPSKFRDSTLSSKHRSAKRQEYAEFYGSVEAPQATSAKVPKDRLRHRSSHREKSGEVAGYGAAGRPEPRPAVEGMKPSAEYGDPKYDQYNMRSSKYGADSGFRY